MGGGADVKKLVQQFTKAQKPKKQPAQSQGAKQVAQASSSRPPQAQNGGLVAYQQPGKPTIDLGPNIKVTRKESAKGRGDGSGDPAAETIKPEKAVANCLSCGKIYLTGAATADVKEFLSECPSDTSYLSVFCVAKHKLGYPCRNI